MGTGESVFSKQTNKVCLERNCVTGLTDKFYCLYTLDMGGSTNFISIDFSCHLLLRWHKSNIFSWNRELPSGRLTIYPWLARECLSQKGDCCMLKRAFTSPNQTYFCAG